MLSNIRKGANNFIMKILFGMIIFAFVGWGIKDILQTTPDFDIVKFSHAKNISKGDFLKARAEQIRIIQSHTGATLTEEEIKQLKLDDFIIKKFINDNILSYLVSYYNFDLSDNTVIQFIKEAPNFKNDQGLFDVNLFKNFLKNSYLNEKNYLSEVKNQILKNSLVNIFLEGFPVPQIISQNIINYMAETREVDLIQIDLKHQSKGEIIPLPTEDNLKDFYDHNKHLFELPEKRSLSYIKASPQIFQQQIHNNQEELLDFYHNNREEFDNKTFSEVQEQINKSLEKQKTETLNHQLARNLEEEVAAGSSLVEISQKYEIPIRNINYISYQEVLDNSDLSQNADNIFKLAEGELSYPIEQINPPSFLLVEIKKIQPSKIPNFLSVKNQIQKLWEEQYLKDRNLTKLQTLSTHYKPEQNIAIPGVSLDTTSFIRLEEQNHQHLPPGLLSSIFKTELNSSTPIFQSQDIAYFAHIRSIKIDKAKTQLIEAKNKENIINDIKNNIIEELINYLVKKNKMEINS